MVLDKPKNNLNVTVVSGTSCLPPVIKTFTPNTGRDNTIVRINGEFLGTTNQVNFENKPVIDVYIFNFKSTFFLPQI